MPASIKTGSADGQGSCMKRSIEIIGALTQARIQARAALALIQDHDEEVIDQDPDARLWAGTGHLVSEELLSILDYLGTVREAIEKRVKT